MITTTQEQFVRMTVLKMRNAPMACVCVRRIMLEMVMTYAKVRKSQKSHFRFIRSWLSRFFRVGGRIWINRKYLLWGLGSRPHSVKRKDENLLGDTTFIPDNDQRFDNSQQKKGKGGSGGSDQMTLYLIIGAVVVGGIIFLKKKKKG